MPSPAGTARAAEQLRGESEHVTARVFFWPSSSVEAKLNDGVARSRGSGQGNTKGEERLRKGIRRRRKNPWCSRSAAVSVGKGS